MNEEIIKELLRMIGKMPMFDFIEMADKHFKNVDQSTTFVREINTEIKKVKKEDWMKEHQI